MDRERMTTLWSVDPGKATGLAKGFYDDVTPYTLEHVLVMHNGVHGVSEWFWLNHSTGFGIDPFVIENFIVRPNQPADPVALEVIGFLKGVTTDDQRHMRLRSDKKFVPDQVLKDHGLWYTGKMVEHTDGRDVNDAIIHAIGWLAFKVKHRPTLDKYFPEHNG